MPFTYRHTLIFDSPGHGFSESLYFQRAYKDPRRASDELAQLRTKRALLLGNRCSIKGDRTAVIAEVGGAPIKRQSFPRKFYLPGQTTQEAAESNISCQMSFTNATSTKRKIQFQGGPWRAVFPGNDVFNPAAGAWGSLFNQWVAEVIAQGMGWMASATAQIADIVAYSFSPNTGHTTFTLGGAGLSWPAGATTVRVQVEFPLSKSPLDGTYLVVPGTTNLLCTTAGPKPAGPFIVTGKMRILAAAFVGLAETNNQGGTGTIQPDGPVSRKRGRPLLVSRGRSPVKNVW